MNELQTYIEENLPDRFKGMKVFRIPVLSDSVLYWASYNNGNWDFIKATSDIKPLLIHNSMSKYGVLYQKDNKEEEPEVDETDELEDLIEQPKAGNGRREKPVKERPSRPVKEKPPKKEKPVKERPVREKPIKEKPIKEKPVRERPVREKPPKKEKPVKEKPVRERPAKRRPNPVEAEDELDALNADMLNEEDFESGMDMPMPRQMGGSYSFTKDKVRKKLTGRIIFSVLFLILTGGSSLLFTIPVIVNSAKANGNINNPVEYWHYRSKSGYLHALNVLSFLLLLAGAGVIAFLVTKGAIDLASLINSIKGGF